MDGSESENLFLAVIIGYGLCKGNTQPQNSLTVGSEFLHLMNVVNPPSVYIYIYILISV